MPAGFGVARVLVLHLLFDRAHFLCNDTVAHGSPLGVGHNGVIRSRVSIEMGLQAVGKRGSQRLVGFALREIESFIARQRRHLHRLAADRGHVKQPVRVGRALREIFDGIEPAFQRRDLLES